MSDDVDVLGYLSAKGLPIKRATGDEIHTACIFCAEDPQKRGRLYINVNPAADIPGLFHCKVCDARGALPSIKKHFGDYTPEQEQSDDTYQRRLIFEEASIYYHEALSERLDIVRYLRDERGLTIETMQHFQLGYADGGLYSHLRTKGMSIADMEKTGLVRQDFETKKMGDFLKHHITIPYRVAGNVVCIRGRDVSDEGGGKYVTPPGQKARIFNSDVTWTASEIVVAEGEFDAMVLHQGGFAAVGVPGANTWQDTWDSYFKDARRTYIVFDTDEPGRKASLKVAERLAPRSRIINLPVQVEGQKVDVSDWLVRQEHTVDEFTALMKRSAGGLLVTVDDAIEEHGELQGQKGLLLFHRDELKSKLDMMLSPGLLPSQVMVFLAKSGTGKTILLLNLFQRIAELQPDCKILFVSLEQTRGDWWERARRIFRFFHEDATDQDAANFWRERLLIVDRNRITEEQLHGVVDDFEYEMGRCGLLALDYLGYFARGYRGEPYQRTGDAMMGLKALGKDRRIPVITPHQVSRMTMYGTEPSVDAARDSGVVEETADFVLPLWSPDAQHGRQLHERTGELKLKIGKSRHGGTGVQQDMYFAPLSLALALANESDYAQQARDELFYQSEYNNTWEEALMRHSARLPKETSDMARVRKVLDRRRQGSLA